MEFQKIPRLSYRHWPFGMEYELKLSDPSHTGARTSPYSPSKPPIDMWTKWQTPFSQHKFRMASTSQVLPLSQPSWQHRPNCFLSARYWSLLEIILSPVQLFMAQLGGTRCCLCVTEDGGGCNLTQECKDCRCIKVKTWWNMHRTLPGHK